MARPKAKIDEKNLEALAERQWTDVQIAAFFGVDERTIQRRFAAKLIECRQRGKAKLLDVLWQRGVAEKSDRILVHLADRVLGPVTQKVEEQPPTQVEVRVVNPEIEARAMAHYKLLKETNER